MRHRIRTVAAIGGLVLAAGVGPAAQGADDGAEPSPRGSVSASDLASHFTPYELQDLAQIAKQDGRPLDDVLREYDGVSQFTDLANRAESELSGTLVQASWGFGQGTIAVQPGGENQARALAATVDVPIAVRTLQRPTQLEQQALVSKATDELAARTDGPLEVGFDIERNAVVATVTGPPPAKPIEDDEVRLRSGQSGKDTDVRLIVDYRADGGPTPAAARGGMSYATCTGGFIVQSSGKRGISTAHHCTSKPTSYDGNKLGTTTALKDRDVRWTRFSSGTSGNTFRAEKSKYRRAVSSGDPAVGGPVCKYGNTTGYTCDKVKAKNKCVTYSGYPKWCGMYVTVTNKVKAGDSGGPWFMGDKAHGITSGRAVGVEDYFSGVGSLNLLGLTVVTK